MIVVETVPNFQTKIYPVSKKYINQGLDEFKKLITNKIIFLEKFASRFFVTWSIFTILAGFLALVVLIRADVNIADQIGLFFSTGLGLLLVWVVCPWELLLICNSLHDVKQSALKFFLALQPLINPSFNITSSNMSDDCRARLTGASYSSVRLQVYII